MVMFMVQWQIRDSAQLLQVVHFNWIPIPEPAFKAVRPCFFFLVSRLCYRVCVCSCFLSRIPNWDVGGIRKKKNNKGALQITCHQMHKHPHNWLRAAAAVTLKPMYREIGPATQLRDIEWTPADQTALTLTFSFGLLPRKDLFIYALLKSIKH